MSEDWGGIRGQSVIKSVPHWCCCRPQTWIGWVCWVLGLVNFDIFHWWGTLGWRLELQFCECTVFSSDHTKEQTAWAGAQLPRKWHSCNGVSKLAQKWSPNLPQCPKALYIKEPGGGTNVERPTPIHYPIPRCRDEKCPRPYLPGVIGTHMQGRTCHATCISLLHFCCTFWVDRGGMTGI